MAYEFQYGEKFELPVVGSGMESNGAPFLLVNHPESNRDFKIFNLLRCQEEETPASLYVKVAQLDINGRMKIRQDIGRVYAGHYKVGDNYAFRISGNGFDSNHKHYYEVEDDLDTHRFYSPEDTYRIEEHILLKVEGIDDHDRLRLVKAQSGMASHPAMTLPAPASAEYAAKLKDAPVLDVDDESQTLEFKSSIVFSAKDSKPHIDDQIGEIMQTLAAFMNSKGGTLLIGVHDATKKVVGIEADYPHLNDSEQDGFTYQMSRDHYKLKIANEATRLLTGHAGQLMEISFEKAGDREYCKIIVEPSKRPVWYRGSQFWIRESNKKRRIVNDELTLHLYNLLKNDLGEFFQPRAPMPEELPKRKPQSEIAYKILWFNDRTWIHTTKDNRDAEAVYRIDVPRDINQPRVVFCYPSGTVNTVLLSKLRSGVRRDQVKKNGWWEGEVPSNIFLMGPHDYLAGYSIDEHGHEFVKLHSILDFNPTENSKNQGGRFVPDAHHVKLYAPVSPDHRAELEALIVPNYKKTTDHGVALDSPAFQDQIELLRQILTTE